MLESLLKTNASEIGLYVAEHDWHRLYSRIIRLLRASCCHVVYGSKRKRH